MSRPDWVFHLDKPAMELALALQNGDVLDLRRQLNALVPRYRPHLDDLTERVHNPRPEGAAPDPAGEVERRLESIVFGVFLEAEALVAAAARGLGEKTERVADRAAIAVLKIIRCRGAPPPPGGYVGLRALVAVVVDALA